MIDRNKRNYVIILVLLSLVALTFRPGLWLTHKPAADTNAYYAKGWEDGCISGTNSWSLLYAPLLDKPFVKHLDVPGIQGQKAASGDKDAYKTGWNEGFTLCRYYQSSVYELMQFSIIIAVLFFIGYLFAKKKN